MNDIIYNPYLPECVYIPDGEPHIFNDRVYIYGSCEKFGSKRYCTEDYHIYSASVDDLKTWKLESIYPRKGVHNVIGLKCKWAPDCVQGNDGRYYLYYCFNFKNSIEIAVSDNPGGPFEYYGQVRHRNGKLYGKDKGDIMCFDPGVFKDDDGRIYLYSGYSANPDLIRTLHLQGIRNVYGNGNQVMELEDDMKTIKSEPKMLIPGRENSKGTGFEGHEMYEASSMRKFNGKYYFIYSSILSHELAYAVSDKPDEGFVYQGALVSNGNIGYKGKKQEDADNYWGNNHGSIIRIKDKYYVFYHRQTNKTEQARQGCAEMIDIDENGKFGMAEMTSQGLNGGPLPGFGYYPAYIACVLKSKEGAIKCAYGPLSRHKYKMHPCVTQTKEGHWKHQFIQGMRDGSLAGYKYFSFNACSNISVHVRGDEGLIRIKLDDKQDPICVIEIGKNKNWTVYSTDTKEKISGIHAVFIEYEGKGEVDILGFSLN